MNRTQHFPELLERELLAYAAASASCLVSRTAVGLCRHCHEVRLLEADQEAARDAAIVADYIARSQGARTEG